MTKELKKKSLLRSLPATILLLAIGAALIIGVAGKMRYIVFGFTDFTALQVDEIHSGMLVDVELVNNYGSFAYRTSTNSDTNKTTITDYYYMIYTGASDDYESEYRYMAIKVDKDMKSAMDAMADDTWDGKRSDALTFSGEINTMTGKVKEYFTDFFEEAGYTEDEIADLTLLYYIDASDSKLSICALYSVFFLGGLALAGWGILRLVKASRGDYIRGFMDAIAATGVCLDMVEEDYRMAQTFARSKGFRAGRLFTYYGLNTTKPSAILNADISWMYQSVTQHRTNGIKSGKTYSINVHTEGKNGAKIVSIPLRGKKAVQEILEAYARRFPWILVGYTEEISKLYTQGKELFLNLKFYRADRGGTV